MSDINSDQQTEMTAVRVCSVNDVPENSAKSFTIESLQIVVCHSREGYYAARDRCTHQDQPLGDGWVEDDTIECPWHGAVFCLKTGKALSLPAVEPLELFEVEIEGDDLWVRLPKAYL